MKFKESNIFVNPIEELDTLKDTEILSDLDIYLNLFVDISKEANELVCLRGNILLNTLLSKTARSTKDLDFDVNMSVDNYNKIILPMLVSFAERLISEGKADTYDIREITKETGGNIRLRKNVEGKEIIVYSVDTSIVQDIRTGSVEYEFNNQTVSGSSIAKILSDKCLATLSIKRYRRMKDFYDIYIILKSTLNFDVKEVYELMVYTLDRVEVGMLLDNVPFNDEVLLKATHAWDKFRLERFDDKELVKPSFQSMYSTVSGLYNNLKIIHNS